MTSAPAQIYVGSAAPPEQPGDGLVRQWQDLFDANRYSGSDKTLHKKDFVKAAGANGFGFTRRVTEIAEVRPRLEEFVAFPGPAFLVRRILRAFALQPHRVATFKLSTDPLFIEKGARYRGPLSRAARQCPSPVHRGEDADPGALPHAALAPDAPRPSGAPDPGLLQARDPSLRPST